MLASTVLLLCSARPPLSPRMKAHATPAHGNSLEVARRQASVRAFERHRLALRDSIVRISLAQVGIPYEHGGISPENGFDCSGLVRYVYSRLYLTPPRTAAKQARIGAAIRRDRLRPGDILTFGVGDSVTHIGIYVGDRKYVHASSVAGRVIVSSMDRRPSERIRPLKGARRLLTIADPFEERLGGG